MANETKEDLEEQARLKKEAWEGLQTANVVLPLMITLPVLGAVGMTCLMNPQWFVDRYGDLNRQLGMGMHLSKMICSKTSWFKNQRRNFEGYQCYLQDKCPYCNTHGF
eukprot:g75120.t1